MAIVFGVVFLLRLLPSLLVVMPTVYGDEYYYLTMAENLAQRGFLYTDFSGGRRSSPGYPVLLAPLFLPPLSRRAAYALVMFVNAALGASVLFPAYGILRRRAPPGWALPGAFLFCLLPALYGFQPSAMSENLFFPLLVWALDLLDRTAERPRAGLHLALGLVAGLAAVTKPQGIAVAVAVVSVVALRVAVPHDGDRTPIRAVLPVLTFLLFPLAWRIHRAVSVPPELLSAGQSYPLGEYLSSLAAVFHSARGLARFLQLVVSDLGYVTIGSFLFLAPAAVMATIRRRAHRYGSTELAAAIIGVLLFGASLLHQNRFAADHFERYLAFGRYIEPLVLFAYLFGLPLLASEHVPVPRRIVIVAAVVAAAALPFIPAGGFSPPNQSSLAFLDPFARPGDLVYGVILLAALLVAARIPAFGRRVLVPLFVAAMLFGSARTMQRTIERSRRIRNEATVGRVLASMEKPVTVSFFGDDSNRQAWLELRSVRWRAMWLSGRRGHAFPIRPGRPRGEEAIVVRGDAPPGYRVIAREGPYLLALR